jgi:hypothetical protein
MTQRLTGQMCLKVGDLNNAGRLDLTAANGIGWNAFHSKLIFRDARAQF